MTWKIELSDGSGPVIADMLEAQQAWKRLSEPAREALEAAYPDGLIRGHFNTVDALYRHGFVEWKDAPGRLTGYHLTDAGKAVARWNLGKKP